MKKQVFTTLGTCLLSLSTTNAEETQIITGTETITSVSSGEITTPSTHFREDATPEISWNVNLAENTITDFLTPGNNPVAKQDLYARITILGTGVTSSNRDGSYTSYQTKGMLKVGSNDWVTVHNGNEDAVEPGVIVYETIVREGEELQFKAAYKNGSWKSFRSTSNSDDILVLYKTDAIPTNKTADDAVKSAEDFLKPILNDDNSLKIGLMDMIYVCELTHTNTSDAGYDLQDLIVYVSYELVNQ
ncbi:hypothetical protein [Rubritalea sp.]|uniref:hypothetical protein n=1 Tax=Rubritalea sp. TaxID=2109375 RepID=UPI003EF23486